MKDIYLDSKRVQNGDFFISLKGNKEDGIIHLNEIIDKEGILLYSDNFNYNYYPNLKRELNRILLNHYNVHFTFKLIGITGTNMKTSLSFLINKALNRYGYKSKCISTIRDKDTYYSSLTTPRNDDLIRFFKQAEEENLDYLIMEVSSIGICEYRVNDVCFDYGILTSLDVDHLDYHQNILFYHLSKIYFIESCKNIVIGINKDKTSILKEILSFFLPSQKVEEYCLSLPQVPGREEIISTKPLIIVDYAHTSSALEYILIKYKKVCKGKLITIIGAGGNRDKTKRRFYGDLVYKYSDFSIITSDNPRNENPLEIINEIIDEKERVIKIVDRKEAIEKGIGLLGENDILLVLGKGDEDYMEINGIKYPFKDKEIIENCLKKNIYNL